MLEQAFPDYKAPINAKEMAIYISDFALKQHNYMNGQIVKVALSNPQLEIIKYLFLHNILKIKQNKIKAQKTLKKDAKKFGEKIN